VQLCSLKIYSMNFLIKNDHKINFILIETLSLYVILSKNKLFKLYEQIEDIRRVQHRDLPSPFESAKSWPHQNRKMQSRFGTLWYNPNFLQLWMGLTISYLDHARRYRPGMGLSSIQEETFPPGWRVLCFIDVYKNTRTSL
jgi:hypothetical protein